MASSAPSPITTVPSIAIASKALRMASIAATSVAISSPRPMSRAEASAAASVTRTSSMARLRSIARGSSPRGSAAQQPLEQRVRLGDEDALLARVAFVVAARQAARLPLVARDVDDEGHRVVGVRLQRARRRMVGHDQQAPLAARGAQPLEQRADHLRVHVLDRLDLLLRVAHVAALVGRLDVQEEEVALRQGAQPVLGLAAEVRVEEP